MLKLSYLQAKMTDVEMDSSQRVSCPSVSQQHFMTYRISFSSTQFLLLFFSTNYFSKQNIQWWLLRNVRAAVRVTKITTCTFKINKTSPHSHPRSFFKELESKPKVATFTLRRENVMLNTKLQALKCCLVTQQSISHTCTCAPTHTHTTHTKRAKVGGTRGWWVATRVGG